MHVKQRGCAKSISISRVRTDHSLPQPAGLDVVILVSSCVALTSWFFLISFSQIACIKTTPNCSATQAESEKKTQLRSFLLKSKLQDSHRNAINHPPDQHLLLQEADSATDYGRTATATASNCIIASESMLLHQTALLLPLLPSLPSLRALSPLYYQRITDGARLRFGKGKSSIER